MVVRLRQFLNNLSETFWLLPAAMVVAGVLAALALVAVDRNGVLPPALLDSHWLYDGGGTGARTLLGAVASSMIGVAGTVFSITIAALSLAAGQMGPRLLRNFTRDRGNQVTLGAYLGTFSYALVVLRSVRTQDEGSFVPHLSLTVAIVLALVCVGTLVYFVGHMAGRINVDTVVELVSDDVSDAMRRLTTSEPPPVRPDLGRWNEAEPVTDLRRGYLQQLDGDGLADWAARTGSSVHLLVRPGDYVFPGTPIARVTPPHPEAGNAIRDATALGPARVSSADLEFAIRQLVEVAVRALSPGINDPHTAISVIDRLGAALCDLAEFHLPGGVWERGGRAVLVTPRVDYDGLLDAMFHMIRQNAQASVAVLDRMLEVLAAVATAERDPARLAGLRRHAGLVLADAERAVPNGQDLADLRRRHAAFTHIVDLGSSGPSK